VRSVRIVVETPRFDLASRVVDRGELVDVQALVAEPPVEGLDEGIFDRFPGANKIELHTAGEGPAFQRPRHELGAVIDGDRTRRGPVQQCALQRHADPVARHVRGHF